MTYDPEWLAITRAFNPYMSTSRYQLRYPDEAEARAAVAQELKWVEENILTNVGENESNKRREKRVDDCQTFVLTAPGPQSPDRKVRGAPRKSFTVWISDFILTVSPLAHHYPNPQTAAFCAMLGIENKVDR